MDRKQSIQDMDNLDLLIVERLGERDRKIKRIEKWNTYNSGLKTTYAVISVLSVAACLAFVFLVASPWTDNESGDNINDLDISLDRNYFRSADSEMKEVMGSIDKKQYEIAIQQCKELLEQSDIILSQLESNKPNVMDEEQEYELEMQKAENEEIRWTYIFLLVKNNEATEALEHLDRYIEGSNRSAHMDEALALREKIKKMKK